MSPTSGRADRAPLIELRRVTKRYSVDRCALDSIDLQLAAGEFVFLTGPSGAGKSTLLKLLFAAERPTSGEIRVAGRALHRIRGSSVPYLRRNIGVVFQDFKLLDRRSVFDNVAYALEVLGRPRAEIRDRVARMLRQVGLGDRLDDRPSHLSGGEQQRVAIARALVNEPTILLADEPTGNLDPDLTLEIMHLLDDINARGTTVVVATHDPTVQRVFDKRRIALLAGRIHHDHRVQRAR